MITFEQAFEKAQKRKVLIDMVSEYENAYVFSYTKNLNLTVDADVIIRKSDGEHLTRSEIGSDTLGNKIKDIDVTSLWK